MIGSSAFSGCPNLTSIVVDSTNTVYDSRDNCNAIIESSTNKLIAGCNTTIIPTSVTSIGKLAFNKSHIKKVEIPSSVTEIETKAFVDCTELDTIICKNPTPIAIDSTIFQNIPTDAVLLVPCGSADAYSSADIWSSFQNIVTYSSDQEINVTICANEIYDFNGQTLYQTGTYTDTLLTEDGCDSIVTLYLISLVGIEDAEPSQIVMYPNPTEDKVYLSLSNIPNAEITIRDISGKVVKRHKVSPSQNEVVLNVEDLASGTYTIMINNNHTHLTKKLIKR